MSAPKSDVLVLGAGASGLYLAAHAASRGRRVLVLEHGPKPARKVLASGGGRCNLTNLAASAAHYLSNNPHFVKSALARHTPWDVLDFFAASGVRTQEKEPGQLFSADGAGAVARALADACAEAGARVLTGQKVLAAERTDRGFAVRCDTDTFHAPALVLALGSPCWPRLGATDLGYRLARSFDLRVVEPRPALVGFRLGGAQRELCRALSGLALPVHLTVEEVQERGDLLFTHTGLSGPAVMQASLAWTDGTGLVVDFLPGPRLEQLVERARSGGRQQLGTLLARHLPKRLVPALLGPDLAARRLAELTAGERERAADLVHSWRSQPTGTEGWERAEVAAGGIDTAHFSSKTMEAREIPGLFAVGEVLDVTGRLGGFNLQWAWSSAFAAAQYV